MKLTSRANIATLFTFGAALFIVLFCAYFLTLSEKSTWLPQFLATLSGLVGASWFVGARLDILDRDVLQRQSAAEAQLMATEKANFNHGVKEAVAMMSQDANLSTSVAGQRWLHSLATQGREEAQLVQSLLCNHIVVRRPKSSETTEFASNSRQSALKLLFHPDSKARYADCEEYPDLSSANWFGLDFSELDVSGAIFVNGDFTGSTVFRTNFKSANLSRTKWSGSVGETENPVNMISARLHGAFGTSCEFTNIDFSRAKFNVNGNKTRFQHCHFIRCNFNRADFRGADFDNCKFTSCHFHRSVWQGVTLHRPAFDGCLGIGIEQCQTIKEIVNPIGLPDEICARLGELGILREY